MSLNGPEAARLYDQHVDAVYAYAARRVGADTAVSVVEDVFEQALRKNAERPKHTPTDLGWLLALTTAFLRRHSETECRRLRTWQPVVSETSLAIPRVSDPLLSDDGDDPSITATAQVMAAVADLEPVDRDVLFLVAWEGCSSALTATATGLAQNEIRPTLARVRKEIRQRVAAAQAPPTVDGATTARVTDGDTPDPGAAAAVGTDLADTAAAGTAASDPTGPAADADADADAVSVITAIDTETDAPADIDWANLEWSDSPTLDGEVIDGTALADGSAPATSLDDDLDSGSSAVRSIDAESAATAEAATTSDRSNDADVSAREDLDTDTERGGSGSGTGSGTGSDDRTTISDRDTGRDGDQPGPAANDGPDADEPDADEPDADVTEPIDRSADPFAMPLASWDEDPS